MSCVFCLVAWPPFLMGRTLIPRRWSIPDMSPDYLTGLPRICDMSRPKRRLLPEDRLPNNNGGRGHPVVALAIPARSNTRRCLEMAGGETSNGSASSATVISPVASRAKIARRVGSDNAKKVSSSCADLELTIWLTIIDVLAACQACKKIWTPSRDVCCCANFSRGALAPGSLSRGMMR